MTTKAFYVILNSAMIYEKRLHHYRTDNICLYGIVYVYVDNIIFSLNICMHYMVEWYI